jgi:hypothetical protein
MTVSEYEERFRPQCHHCIKSLPRSEDPAGDGGVDASGSRSLGRCDDDDL